MNTGQVQGQSGYAGVARQLAKQALSVAVDASPHRAQAGERRWSMAQLLPAARVLLDEAKDDDQEKLQHAAQMLSQTLGEPHSKITDGFGHHRPIYGLLAIHLLGSAARLLSDDMTLGFARQSAIEILNSKADRDPDPRLAVWRRLIARQHELHEAEDMPLPSDEPAPLVPLGLNDLIDSWTYRELVGMHGLYLCALIQDDASLAQRVTSATHYHLGHTQPDYTTYQPWGLAGFASDPMTAVFAEQQLHDVATHLSIEGPGGAVMPALLLAEGAATMAGTVTKAWRSI